MKRIITFLLAVTMITGMMVYASAEETVIQIFVSPNGSDTAAGTFEEPLATLEGAKNKVTEIKKGNVPVEVNFLEGDYRMDTAVSFTRKDSGTAEALITYKAYDGAKVRFLGSVVVDETQIHVIKDQKILNRMVPEAYGKVGIIDLAAQGLKDFKTMEETIGNGHSPDSMFDAGSRVYLNGKEEIIASYPNNFDETAVGTKKADNLYGALMENSWEVSSDAASRIARWDGVANAFVRGRFTHGYRHEINSVKEINGKAKTITTNATKTGASTKDPYQIVNLYEEIDIPGEFYIDTKKSTLYYYPSQSLKEAELSISRTADAVSINGASYLNFEGISFEEFTRMAFEISKSDNINILSCTMKNIGGSAVKMTNTTKSSVQGCDISFIGQNAVTMAECGDFETLEPAENLISNNNIFFTGTYRWVAHGISAYKTVGCTIKNNLIGRCNGTGIYFIGNDNKILYNELYDVGYMCDDGGAIYTGQNPTMRGNEVAYNFVNGALSKGNAYYAIYVDDMNCGVDAHHNVVKDSTMGFLYGGGRNNSLTDNIVINCVNPIKYDNRGTTWGAGGMTSFKALVAETLQKYPVYGKYENFKEYPTDDAGVPKYVTIKDNMFYNCSSLSNIANEVKNYGIYENNEHLNDAEFVDAQSNNFEIKEGGKAAEKFPGLLEIDFSKIGLMRDEYRHNITPVEMSKFRLLEPANGTRGITNKETTFRWTRAGGASMYTLEVAEDKEFTNIVYKQQTREEQIIAKGLPTGMKTLYWRVKAVNNSRQLFNEAYSPTYVMQSAQYDALSTADIKKRIKTAKNMLEGIEEGNENGKFAPGSKNLLTGYIEAAEAVASDKTTTQNNIDLADGNLRAAMEGIIKAQSFAYNGVENMVASPENWTSEAGVVERDGTDGIINRISYATFNEKAPVNSVQCFKFRIKGFNGSWMVMGLNQAAVGKQWGTDPAYFICITGSAVEYQKSKAGVLETIPNTYFGEEKWHEIQAGAIECAGGVRTIFSVDGQLLYDVLDMDDPQPLDGYFSLGARSEDTYMAIAPTDDVPDDYVGTIEAAEEQIELLKSVYAPTGGVIASAKTKEYRLSELLNDSGDIDEAYSSEKTESNLTLNFSAVVNPDGAERCVAFRKSDADISYQDGASGYEFVIKDDKLMIKKYKNGIAEYLNITKKSIGEGIHDFSITASNSVSYTNIKVTIDGSVVIDLNDTTGINSKGYVGVYGSGGSMSIE